MEMRHYVIAYDVATTSDEGKRRLRRVAKACESRGQRVQNSVFEVVVTLAQLEELEARLCHIMDPGEDSLRIYSLKGRAEESVKVYGLDHAVDFTGPLVF